MGSGGDGFEVPPQAFFLTLEDDLIENMIQSVQSGQELQLRLGSEPVRLGPRAVAAFSDALLVYYDLTDHGLLFRCSNMGRLLMSLALLPIRYPSTFTLQGPSNRQKVPSVSPTQALFLRDHHKPQQEQSLNFRERLRTEPFPRRRKARRLHQDWNLITRCFRTASQPRRQPVGGTNTGARACWADVKTD